MNANNDTKLREQYNDYRDYFNEAVAPYTDVKPLTYAAWIKAGDNRPVAPY